MKAAWLVYLVVPACAWSRTDFEVDDRCAPGTCAAPPIPGLVHHWSFDGVSADAAGSAHGTMHGDAGYTAGVSGDALALDGDGDYLATALDSPEAEGAAITVSAWIEVAAGPVGFLTIVAKDRSGFEQWNLRRDSPVENNGVPEIIFTTDTSSGEELVVESGGAFPDDSGWHHVAAVYDGAAVRLYGDGVLIGGPVPQSGAFDARPNALCVGASGETCNEVDGWFSGAIDDVRIYDRGLDAAEVATLYEAAL
jgi:hypothetical protein